MHNAESKKRRILLAVCVACLLVISSFGAIATFPRLTYAQNMTHSLIPAKTQPNSASTNAGATLPYVELEAHSATTNGTVVGPDYQLML